LIPQRLSSVSSLQWYRLIRYSFLLLTSILLAQLQVSQADIGGYELIFHLVYVLSFFWINGVFQVVLIRSGQLEPPNFKKFLDSVWSLVLVLSACIGFLLWLLGDWGAQLLFGLEFVRYWNLYILLFVLSLGPLVYEYFLLARRKYKALLWWGTISYSLHILCTLLPFLWGYGFREMMLAHIGLSAIRLFIMAADLGFPRWRGVESSWWKASGQLTMYSILGGIPVAFDTWLVGYVSQSEGEIAIFRYGARELPLLMIILGSIHLIIISEQGNMETLLSKIRSQIDRSMLGLAFLTGLLCLFSPWLFKIFFTERFVESAFIFNVYLLIILSRWNLSHTVMMRLEKYSLMNFVALGEVLLNVVLSVWWVQYWGWVGVALATVVAYLFEKIVFSLLLFKKEGIRFGQYMPVKAYLGSSLFILICFIVGSFFLHQFPY